MFYHSFSQIKGKVVEIAENKKETTAKFVILNLIGLGLNTGILYLLVDMVGFNKLIALVITTGIVMIINYIVNKLWVFKEK